MPPTMVEPEPVTRDIPFEEEGMGVLRAGPIRTETPPIPTVAEEVSQAVKFVVGAVLAAFLIDLLMKKFRSK